MHLKQACEAIEKGCRLEIYFSDRSLVVEPHAVGFDRLGHTLLLGWECTQSGNGDAGSWRLLELDDAREVDVSGYFSQAPRPGFVRNDPHFARIVLQV